MASLHGKVALVTGAARGIGAATARGLASRGARVALVGLEPDRLERLADDLGPAHLWAGCDVTDSAALEAVGARVVDELGGIDVVVANAGINAGRGTVAVAPVEALARTVEVNLTGMIRTVHATLAAVSERQGHYLLVASASSFAAMPGLAAYAASKAGVEQFAHCLRLEVAHRGVTVGTAHPSWVDSDMLRTARADLPVFDAALPRLPWPFARLTSVEECGEALVDGVARRRHRVFVPRALGVVSALRPVLSTPLGQRLLQPPSQVDVTALEAQARGLQQPAARAEATRPGA